LISTSVGLSAAGEGLVTPSVGLSTTGKGSVTNRGSGGMITGINETNLRKMMAGCGVRLITGTKTGKVFIVNVAGHSRTGIIALPL
jgi:hypothetical protein